MAFLLPNPSVLHVVYDGKRRHREMVYIEPHSQWGGRAYGLDPRTDDYSFQPRGPGIGSRVRLSVSDDTLGRLARQRDLRGSHRRRVR